MRADIVYSDRVIAFRKAGQVTAADQLRAKANSLSHITDPKQLWKHFADHQRDFAHKS